MEDIISDFASAFQKRGEVSVEAFKLSVEHSEEAKLIPVQLSYLTRRWRRRRTSPVQTDDQIEPLIDSGVSKQSRRHIAGTIGLLCCDIIAGTIIAIRVMVLQ